MNILIVDDEIVQARSIKRGLRKDDYNCFTANNGKDALKMISEHPVELAIIDYVMPEMNGLELIREVKKKWPLLKIILMTAYQNIDSSDEHVCKHIDGFIRKPFTISQLKSTIREIFMQW